MTSLLKPMLLLVVGAVSLAAARSGARAGALPLQPGPCYIGDSLAHDLARRRVNDVLTDSTLLATRSEAGLTGLLPSDVSIVTDTITCKQALTAFHQYYAALDSAVGVRASGYTSGTLIKIGANRYVLAVLWINPFTGLTYTVFDSSFAVVMKGF